MISEAQRIYLFADLWPPAERALGMDHGSARDRRQARLNYLSHLLDRPITSANDLNRTTDFGKVKDALLILSGNLRAAVRDVKTSERKAENKRWLVRHDLLPCLAVYCRSAGVPSAGSGVALEPSESRRDASTATETVALPGLAGAEALLAEAIKDLFHRGSRVEPPTLDELTDDPRFGYSRKFKRDMELPSQLDSVLMWLGKNIQQRRKRAGDTIHDMRTGAGLKCECKACCQSRVTISSAPDEADEAEEMHVGELVGATDDNNPF